MYNRGVGHVYSRSPHEGAADAYTYVKKYEETCTVVGGHIYSSSDKTRTHTAGAAFRCSVDVYKYEDTQIVVVQW